jgi:hypothetical protein
MDRRMETTGTRAENLEEKMEEARARNWSHVVVAVVVVVVVMVVWE